MFYENKCMKFPNLISYRADDYNDPIHLERISTLNMFETRDLGAIPTGKISFLTEFIIWQYIISISEDLYR